MGETGMVQTKRKQALPGGSADQVDAGPGCICNLPAKSDISVSGPIGLCLSCLHWPGGAMKMPEAFYRYGTQ